MEKSKFHKGIWLFIQSEEFVENPKNIEKTCEKLSRGKFDLINLCVKVKDGYLSYQTKIGNINPDFKKWDPLEVFCREARKRNIKVHVWFCIHPEGNNSKLLQEHHELIKITKDGPHPAVCMMRNEVQDYEFSLYREVIQNYDIAGVHLDYIRTGAGVCICEYCRQWVMKETNANPESIVEDDGLEEFIRWCKWRTENITKFVDRVYNEAQKRLLKVSAAVLKDYPRCIIKNGQDWGDWAEKGLVDFLFPMNYSTDTLLVKKYAEIHKSIVKDNCEMWVGLGTWHPIEQAKTIKELGMNGVVFFESENKPLTDEILKILASL